MNEEHFADAIGGKVQRGNHTDKKDVIDARDNSHSVKAGEWWQIFLYGEERLKTDIIFQILGDVAAIMLDCLNAYPATYEEYLADKNAAKQALRPHMRRLAAELSKPRIFKGFLDKALFDGGNAQYLSIYPGPAKAPKMEKDFHVFAKDDVTTALLNDLTIANSLGQYRGQTPEQKVVFKSNLNGKQIGEIEARHDSAQHFREMKFRLNSPKVMKILEADAGNQKKEVFERVTAYGKAIRTFKA